MNNDCIFCKAEIASKDISQICLVWIKLNLNIFMKL
jgi:hypothetical protein